jgi:lipoprotein signal peptidase
MPLFKDISKYKLLILGILLISLNFLAAFLINNFKIYSVKNYFPVGFVFATPFLIVAVGSFLIYRLQLLTKFPIITSFLIAGAVSNFLEYSIFGYVVDYINIGIAVLNLADVEIYGGLIMLNWKFIRE